MKMNISILADALAWHFPLQKTIARHIHLTLGHTCLYTSRLSFQEGGVYLAKGEDFPADPVFPKECAVISVGPAAAVYQQKNCDYIELNASADPMEVLNCLQCTYDQYDSWYSQIQSAVIEGSSLQQIFDLSLPIFVNPIYCTDSRYNQLAYAEYPELTDPPQAYDDPDVRNRMINELKMDPHYEESFHTTDPTLWSDTVTPFDTIYCNIFYDGEYWGKVMIDERSRPFRPSDYVLAGVLRNIIETALIKRSFLPGNEFRLFDKLIMETLDGMSLDKPLLQEELEKMRWSAYHSFVCTVIHMDKRDLIANSALSCCTQVERHLKYCRAFPYQEQAVIIVPLEAWQNKADYFCSALSPILRDGLYKAAISGTFTDLSDIRLFHSQAIMALQMGIKSSSTQWIFHYDQYLLDYMLENSCGTLPPRLLCHPGLITLMEYDRKNDVSYTRTLKAYVENNCSQAHTCRAIYLHRSTLLQRLSRIGQLTGFDLEDEKVRLYLRLIFAVLSYHGVELPG